MNFPKSGCISKQEWCFMTTVEILLSVTQKERLCWLSALQFPKMLPLPVPNGCVRMELAHWTNQYFYSLSILASSSDSKAVRLSPRRCFRNG
ncbi:hypothetical protein E2320_012913 [Naja naja]|nr:hypothetical protein E2320_012913 [Naja naja]